MMSKEIPLTQGHVALVDDEDFKWLNRWKWHARKDGNTWYASGHSSAKNGKPTTILMHRLILGLEPGDPRETDHKNHNGLDNHRGNLRIATGTQNMQNQRPRKGTSIYKGVSWFRRRAKWQARIQIEGRKTHLGLFDSEIEAAKVYDTAARKYFGEFAHTNF